MTFFFIQIMTLKINSLRAPQFVTPSLTINILLKYALCVYIYLICICAYNIVIDRQWFRYTYIMYLVIYSLYQFVYSYIVSLNQVSHVKHVGRNVTNNICDFMLYTCMFEMGRTDQFWSYQRFLTLNRVRSRVYIILCISSIYYRYGRVVLFIPEAFSCGKLDQLASGPNSLHQPCRLCIENLYTAGTHRRKCQSLSFTNVQQ